MIAGQDVAITSPIPGTTTDVVEKTMELLPIGPVVFLDTAGFDDTSVLGEKRIERTKKIFDRADIAVLVCEPDIWTEFEEEIQHLAKDKKIPLLYIMNKVDLGNPSPALLKNIRIPEEKLITCSATDSAQRERTVNRFKEQVLEVCPEGFLNPPPLLGDLIPKRGLVVLIVPIDIEAPKGRIILPQVQAIRDALDADAVVLTVKESEYAYSLSLLNKKPDLVVCDSQVVDKMVADTPADVPCTTFSIILARQKGDLPELTNGAKKIDSLKNGDKVLIAEACSHHALEDDIGRVKLPRWIKEHTKADIRFETVAGRDYPADLKEYSLIVHCGSCMHNRREMLSRIHKAKEAGVAITNYGVAIAHTQGVLARVLAPFGIS